MFTIEENEQSHKNGRSGITLTPPVSILKGHVGGFNILSCAEHLQLYLYTHLYARRTYLSF